MKANAYPSSCRAFLPLLLAILALIFSLQQGKAIIDVNMQMQLGNPTGATANSTNSTHHLHYLIQRPQYALDYSDTNRQPNWVSWDLTSSDVGSSGRTDAWAVETNLPPDFHLVPTSTFGSVNGQTYDRGHMCPSADRTDTVADNTMTFIMSNIIPQASQNNQGLWATFETYSRSLLSNLELLIISGPSNFGTNRIASGGHGAIASNVWKIVVCVPLGAGTAFSRITNADPNSIRVIAINTPNDASASGKAWTSFVTSTKQIQQETGYNFFSVLPNNLAWVLRSKVDGQTPATPSSISFSPPSGPATTSVTINGLNLDSTTNVTFNGTSAIYGIDSPTQLTAIVPAGASSGPISVRGLGGNGVGSLNFTVLSGGKPDLTLTTTHAGDFTQGDIGDTYTVTITNAGLSATVGTVSVTNILPSSLTATAISGTGWIGNLGTLSATRSDPLPPGATYPPLLVTVNVPVAAPPTVTNLVTVAGGGETNSLNNTASHLTAINALPTVSPFLITATDFVGPNQLAITWTSVSGHTYQVQSTTNLVVADWTTHATLTATTAFTSWTNLAAYGAAGFYRVVATP